MLSFRSVGFKGILDGLNDGLVVTDGIPTPHIEGDGLIYHQFVDGVMLVGRGAPVCAEVVVSGLGCIADYKGGGLVAYSEKIIRYTHACGFSVTLPATPVTNTHGYDNAIIRSLSGDLSSNEFVINIEYKGERREFTVDGRRDMTLLDIVIGACESHYASMREVV